MSLEKTEFEDLFKTLDNRETAIQVVDSSFMFYCFAYAVQVIPSLFDGLKPNVIIGFFIVVGCGWYLHNHRSRVAATVLLLLSALTVISFLSFPEWTRADIGMRIIVSELVKLWTAIRFVEATFKIHGRFLSP